MDKFPLHDFKRCGGGDYTLRFHVRLTPDQIQEYLNIFDELSFTGHSEDEKETLFYFKSPKWSKRN